MISHCNAEERNIFFAMRWNLAFVSKYDIKYVNERMKIRGKSKKNGKNKRRKEKY
jgi:hypothetical protein